MSLDVYLYNPVECPRCHAVLENNENLVFTQNITHNLCKMATYAGLYYPLWRPELIGIFKAKKLIPFLEAGLMVMKAKPEEFKKYDDPGGWGMYKHFVPWIEQYLTACMNYPNAVIRISK